MLDKVEQLRNQALEELQAADSAETLEQWRISWIGAKGQLKGIMAWIKDIPGDQKKAFGQAANSARKSAEEAFNTKKQSLGPAQPDGPMLDITEPALKQRMGRTHIIGQTVDELIDLFSHMGFSVAEGPEVEDERHNFDALNIPRTHPARDPNDNFYITDPFADLPRLLRSQTSTVQIRTMQNGEPPIRIVSPGRVYRPDEHDATHYSMFHQIEGLYVDRQVTMADLKTTLMQFAHAYFGPEADIKLVPSYFPFTEPSAELYVKVDFGQGPVWMEIGGCGMVDPAVFEAVGIDNKQWTGFAFGLGVERLTMRKYGIKDIRALFENDVRFLKQF